MSATMLRSTVRSPIFSVLVIILFCDVRTVSADKMCYTHGGVFGIVFATMISTVVACVIAFLAYNYLWKPRRKGKACDKLEVVEDGNDKFAYDNPYFQEEDGEKKTPIPRNDSDSSIKKDPATQIDGAADKSEKLKNGKLGSFPNLIFANPGNKPKSLKDSFMSLEPEIVNVPLRGHDFSGLGFNITGNMRDGIFVKDVLHRGPASESGQLRIGDRILSVTISFSSMVYEDALTILSYASPYDVSLELKKAGRSNLAGHEKKASMSSNDIMNVANGLSASSDRLYHPIYRSKSIDDLTQIGKDQLTGGLAMNGGIPPKRSLSIGTPVHRLRKEKIQNKENPQEKMDNTVPKLKPKVDTSYDRRSSSNSSISSKSSLDSEKKHKEDSAKISSSDVVIVVDKEDEGNQTKEQDATSVVEITGDPDKSAVIVKTGSGLDIVDDASMKIPFTEETKIDIFDPDEVIIILDNTEKEAELSDKKSRKKGKAPPPPPVTVGAEPNLKEKRRSSQSSSCSSSNGEESFKDANDVSNLEEPSLITTHDASLEPDSLENTEYHPTVSTLSRKSSSSSVSEDSLDGTDSLRRKKSKKSSSLGDIPKAEDVASGTDSLERATSLDLKKDLVPEGTLGEQNKHLKRRAPNPPPSSSSSSDDTLPSDQRLFTEDSIESPEDLVYKASVVDIIDEDSLEKISLKVEKEDTGDPDSLEVDTKSDDVEITSSPTTHVITNNEDVIEPEQRSRKSSTSSDSSKGLEKSEQMLADQDETITKIKVSISPNGNTEDHLSSSSKEEEITEMKENEFLPTDEEFPLEQLSRKSSSSSTSSKEEAKTIIIDLSRKDSTSSSSSSSSNEDVDVPNVSLPRKRSPSPVSSDEVEETIVKLVRKPIQAEFFPLSDLSDNESTATSDLGQQPQRKVVSADELKLDSTISSSESEPSLNEYPINETPPPSIGIPDTTEQIPAEPVTEPPEVKVAIKKPSSDLLSLNLPIIPPLITTANKTPPNNTETNNPPKAEVIEISQQELDDVMMTHEQFMKKQALKQKEMKPTKSDAKDISFEDWSIMSSRSSDLNTVNGNTTYSPSFETNISIDGVSSQPVVITNSIMKEDPEVVKIATSMNPDLDNDPTMPQLKTLE